MKQFGKRVVAGKADVSQKAKTKHTQSAANALHTRPCGPCEMEKHRKKNTAVGSMDEKTPRETRPRN